MARFRTTANSKRRRLNPLLKRYSRGRAAVLRRRNRRGRMPTSGRGVTFEHDRQGIYRKKKMPYGKKKRWMSFKRKVYAASEKSLGSRTVLFNATFQHAQSTAQKQGVESFCLYGWSSNIGPPNRGFNNDLSYIANLENEAANLGALQGNLMSKDAKFMFQSAILDLTIRNTSQKDGQIDPDATIELDIYEMTMRKKSEIEASDFGSLKEVFTTLTNQYGIQNNNTALTGPVIRIEDRGATPWELTTPLSDLGVRIWKKTKFFLRAGQTCTYQVRDPKRHVAEKRYLDDGGIVGSQGFNKPGWTKNILLIFKTIPGIIVGADPGKTQQQIDVGCTRKYMYKVRGLTESRSIYVAR